jgi:hypothetical protein
MTPYEQAATWHIEHCPETPFREILEAHLFHGYVISGPDRFVLGRQVSTQWSDEQLRDPMLTDEQGDGWMVWLWAGVVSDWRSVVPFPLPYLIWHRGERLRRHRFPSGKWRK